MNTIGFRLVCGACGGNFGGHALRTDCPHCGADIDRTVDTRVVNLDTGLVDADLICAGCGYNLRTMPVTGQCPECFAPVLHSVGADELRFAPVEWLSRLRAGFSVLIIAATGLVGIPISIAPFWVLFGGTVDVILGIAAVALLVSTCIGIFAVTSARPIASDALPVRVPPDALRDASRLLLLGVCALVTLAICTGSPGAVALASFIGAACLTGCLACATACLRRLARRHRQDDLDRRTTVLIWLLIICGVSGIAGFGADVVHQQVLAGRIADVFLGRAFAVFVVIVAVVGFGTLLGAWTVGLITLFQFRAMVSRAIALAPPAT